MPSEIVLTLDVRIPWWKRAVINSCVWLINHVVDSIRNDVKVVNA